MYLKHQWKQLFMAGCVFSTTVAISEYPKSARILQHCILCKLIVVHPSFEQKAANPNITVNSCQRFGHDVSDSALSASRTQVCTQLIRQPPQPYSSQSSSDRRDRLVNVHCCASINVLKMMFLSHPFKFLRTACTDHQK